MAPALVAVEIAPPEAAPLLKQSLLDACTRAAEERCVEPEGDQEANVVAIVSWGDPLHARLEVALRREQRWVARAMAFSARDAPTERWRAVGLVIGTLASLMARTKETPADATAKPPPATPPPASEVPPAPPAAAPPRSEAAPPTTPSPPPEGEPASPAEPEPDHVEAPSPVASIPVRRRRGFVGASAIVGTALDRGSPRLGGELDGHLLLGAGLYALAGAAYSGGAARVDGVQTTFAEAFLGLLYARELGASFIGAVHAEALGELFSPSIENGGGGPTTGERWLGGARLGADVYYWRTDPIGFFAGASAKWTAAPTDVRASGAYVGSAPTVGYVVRAGAAYGFW